jgi:two-component system, sensor histidine kinase PdtaS
MSQRLFSGATAGQKTGESAELARTPKRSGLIMEQRKLVGLEGVVDWLPRSGQPLVIRLASATCIMAVAVVLEWGLALYLGLPGLSLLLFAVFVCAVVFDHGTGYYASAIAIIAAYFQLHALEYRVPTLLGEITFALLCAAAALFGEALRSAMERALAGERTTRTLLAELQHRTQNTLSIIVALLETQIRSTSNPEAKEALKLAANRVRIQSEAHRHLSFKSKDKIDAQEYLTQVCRLMEQSLRGGRSLKVECEAEHTLIDPQKALTLGLIANELITNSIKYAYKEHEEGTIAVKLDRDENGLVRLRVQDDGAGCPENAPSGTGTQLISALVKEHKGTYKRSNREKGCEVVVTLAPTQRQPLKLVES